MFRIVEEALRNVERHARARTIEVELAHDGGDTGGRFTVRVCDDGLGFDPEAPAAGHFGLVGMREQAALIGAELKLDSAPGQGTRVQLDFDA